MDNLTPQQRRLTMSRIKSRDTKVELLVRRALHAKGRRFRVNVATLPGKPDVAFSRIRLAVFVDGDFWHGWKFADWQMKLAPYWREKIGRNIERDAMNGRCLPELGWTVLRLWEYEVTADLEACIERIEIAADSLSASLQTG
jgi:DNA mismatch endonuclease (patch repair protein)